MSKSIFLVSLCVSSYDGNESIPLGAHSTAFSAGMACEDRKASIERLVSIGAIVDTMMTKFRSEYGEPVTEAARELYLAECAKEGDRLDNLLLPDEKDRAMVLRIGQGQGWHVEVKEVPYFG